LADETGAVTEQSDLGEGQDGIYSRWNREIQAYDKTFEYWRQRVPRIIERFRAERDMAQAAVVTGSDYRDRRLNILWSNVRTLQPALYSRTPVPEVSRRYGDEDPVGRAASIIIERALTYGVEQYDFDGVMKHARDDYLLTGRGQGWVRYIPTFGPEQETRIPVDVMLAPDGSPIAMAEGEPVKTGDVRIDEATGAPYVLGEPFQPLLYEEVRCDYVNWADFGHTIAPVWEKVRAVWKREMMTRDQLVARFGEIGKEVGLSFRNKGFDDETDQRREEERNEVFKRGVVYEIWDKETRKVYWISPGLPGKVLDQQDDPLGLEGFFPCPKPVYDTMTTDSLVPVPEYVEYQSQAEELDELTRRIYLLLKAVRVFGFYNGALATDNTELQNIMDGGYENIMLAVQDWVAHGEKGGARGQFDFFPIDAIVQTIQVLSQMREMIKQDLYEITGISDVVRGASKASETLGAQQLKARFASLRLDDRKAEVERFARDLLRLKAEIIAEHFAPETLALITGYSEMPGVATDPNARAVFEQAVALLRDQKLRSFRIDVETDSTVLPDREQEQAAAVQFLQAVTPFMEKMYASMQAFPAGAPLFKEMLMLGVRSFRKGRTLETSFEQALNALVQQVQTQPPPQEDAVDPTKVAKVQLDQQKFEYQKELDAARLMTQQATTEARLSRDDERMQADSARGMQALAIQQNQLAAQIEDMAARQALQERRFALDTAKFAQGVREDAADRAQHQTDSMIDAFGVALKAMQPRGAEAR
jgi:hypothetical protein